MSSTSGPSATTPASVSVTFPDNLAGKIIWTPNISDEDDGAPTPTDTTADAPTTNDSPALSTVIPIPKFTFAESIIGEAKASIAHSLSPSVQMGIVKTFNLHLEDEKDKKIKEPLVNVLYPRDGCHEIIDAAIRATAQDEEADVLVIDSLELALGELGAFGKGAADLLSALYKEPVIPDEEEEKDEGAKEEKAEGNDAPDSSSKESTEKGPEKDDSESPKESAEIGAADIPSALYKESVNPDEEEMKEDGAKEKSKSEDKDASYSSSKESAEKDASDSASEASSFEVVSDNKPSEKVEGNEKGGEEKEDEEENGEAEKEEDEEEKEEEEEEKTEPTDEEEKEKRKQERIESEKARIDRELQDVFDKLVSLPPADKEPTQSRIIYWRDFTNIAHSASPILIRLFRAMHARRTAKFSKGSMSRDLLQPTVLVLGHSTSFAGKYSYRSLRDKFTHGNSALKSLLPYICKDAVTLKDVTTSTELPVPSQAFFLTSLSKSNDDGGVLSETCSTPFKGKFEFSDFDTSGSTIAVFPEGSDKKKFSQIEERLAGERSKAVANAWLKVALAQCGGAISTEVDVLGAVGDDKDVDADLVREEKDVERKEKEKETKEHIPKGSRILDLLVKRTSSPLPVALERLVTAAFALAPKPVVEGSVEVEVASFAKAYMSIIQTVKANNAWNAWWRRNKMLYDGSSSDSDDEDEDEEEKDKKGKKEDPIVRKVKNAGDLTQHESRLLSCIVDTGELVTSFDDVCISESTVETLRTIVSLPLLFPSAFKSGVLAKEAIGGVLLYGPPGTGKTLVCRAVAKECGARMLAIKPSDIMDCWVGESEKLVNAVFSLAYRLAPCLIFIDELDSLFRKRQNDDKKWVRDILAEFLQSMDGLRSAKKNKEAGVIVIGATNRPHDIDDAVLRRLPSRMIVDVPGEDEREKILKLHLRGETLEQGFTLTDIARKTVNYSGSDLKNLCVSAAMASVKEALGTFSWKVRKPKDEEKKDEVKKDEKDDDKTNGKVEKKDDQAEGEKEEEKEEEEENQETEAAKERISKRIVKMSHFVQAMNEVPASSASGSHSELRRWHEQFGKKSPVSAASSASKPSYGVAGSSIAASRYTGYGSSAAGAGAGSTPRYGGYGSGESGSTPRYGASTSDSSALTTTPRYGSYGAGAGGSTATLRYGAGAATPAASSTPSTTAGTPAGESTAPRYGSGGFSASSYLSGLGKGSAATGSTDRYTPGAGGAGGSYKYGATVAPAVEEKSSVEEVIEPEQVVAPEPDSDQKQKDAEDEEAKP